ncbi:DUF1707 and DUF2154 domain-containing protein [Dactylosporangium vinaceum]|uniref:DUF1707 domain-containing protein n=1 Tax=Dactylosporangium vinaceum TaxID=53362 RepID=A0ABV5LZX8_9ACTN|nr:DUF1707 domain-containing protein [Dactylosporangium vinaceum]UAB94355.1 DUF1707 and DUF2154 domain-containing protein [Dactylosporangium vinaceum]
MGDLPERIDPRLMRASDADRERVAEVLRTAAAEGRLDLDEVDERLHAVYAARTYADLEPVLHDLPTAHAAPVPGPGGVPARPGEVPATGSATAIMSGFTRRGPWVVPRTFTGTAFWGGGTIDLREARMLHGEVTIRAFAVMGGITVIVPEDAEVHVTGTGIMGGFAHDASGPGRHGAARIHITGFAWWGGVNIERRRRKRRDAGA